MSKYISSHKNRLIPIRFDHRDKWSDQFWLYRCICGNEKIISKHSVDRGNTKSCGCLHDEISRLNGQNSKTHGEGRKGCKTKEFRIWAGIKVRCFNPNHHSYKNYGGRGITMHGPWIHDYQAFLDFLLSTIGRCPECKSLDRIDNDGNYEPGNLRWATQKEQNNNRKRGLDLSKEEKSLILKLRENKLDINNILITLNLSKEYNKE